MSVADLHNQHQLPPPSSTPLAPPMAAGPQAWYRRIPAWVGPVAVGAFAVGACAYTVAVDPNTEAGIFPQCYFRQLTGLDCPGCGLTRSVHALLTGDPGRALDHNILAAIVLPLMLYAYIAWTANSFGVRLPQVRMSPWMAWIATGVVLGFWVVRNLPGPFEFLDATA